MPVQCSRRVRRRSVLAQRTMMPALGPALVLALALALGHLALVRSDDDQSAWGAGAPAAGVGKAGPSPQRPAVRALAVLRGWDRRRAAAYATGDARLLRQLYAPGSRAGARDVGQLRSYVERGLVVRELTVQVLDVELMTARPDLARLRVVDRVVGGTAVRAGGGRSVPLPVGRTESRVVTLLDVGHRWVVRAVRRPR